MDEEDNHNAGKELESKDEHLASLDFEGSNQITGDRKNMKSRVILVIIVVYSTLI